MSTIRHNFRIVVQPKSLGDYGGLRVPDSFGGYTDEQIARRYEERCKDMAEQIQRHVDYVSSAYVEADVVCKYCLRDPEPDINGMPQCCDSAISAKNDKGDLA